MIQIKERPILFSAQMVLAILEGRKSMTRRVVTPQPDEHRWSNLPGYAFSVRTYETSEGLSARFQHHLDGVGEQPLWVKSPYGNVGDRLWVRENFRAELYGGFHSNGDFGRESFETIGIEYAAGGPHLECHFKNGTPTEGTDGSVNYEMAYRMANTGHDGFRPSIHMPRWASRINLEITGVKVERLNQISNTDILREGIRSESCNICVHSGGSGCDSCFSILKPFRELWDSINGKTPGKSWEDNPLVFVVSFKRVSNNL